jgi:DNA-binding NarL/FixJ family response regulator
MVTPNSDPGMAALAIEVGAKGYVATNDDRVLFVSAVKSVAEGCIFLGPEMASEIAFRRASAKATKISNLTQRELKIVRLMAAGRTTAEIAAGLVFPTGQSSIAAISSN